MGADVTVFSTIYLASSWMDLTNQSAVGSATSHIQTELYLLG